MEFEEQTAMTSAADDEALALEIASEAAEAGKDRGLKPTEVANALVQAAMQIIEENPPSDHAVRPMWLADSVASIRAALDARVQNVVGMRELFEGSMSPLTLAVVTALVRRVGGDNFDVTLGQNELASSASLSWSFKDRPNRLVFRSTPAIENPQGREGGTA